MPLPLEQPTFCVSLGRYPFEDSIFSFSGMVRVGEYLYVFGGGHSATPEACVTRFHIATQVWSRCYEPLPIETMKQWVAVPVAIPGETHTDASGEYAGKTFGGQVCGPAGTIYKSPWLDAAKVWRHPDYLSQPISRHSYHEWIVSSRTGKIHMLCGNNGSNIGGPIGRIALNGNRCAYDPAANAWTIGGSLLAGTVCEDPNTGYFWQITSNGYVRVFDPVTDTVLKSTDSRNQKFFTTPYKNPFVTDEALFWHPILNVAIYINRAAVPRVFVLKIDPITHLPMFTELVQSVAASCPMPTSTIMHSRKWAWNDAIGKAVGGLAGGYMWSLQVNADLTCVWNRMLAPDAQAFSSSFANVVADGIQYCVAYPPGGKPMETYALKWELPEEPPPVEEPPPGEEPPPPEEPPPVDITAPNTELQVLLDGDTATFHFSGTDDFPGELVFEAALDGGPFAVVTSPLVHAGLAAGGHELVLASKDVAGNVDLTPASAVFTILPQPPAPTWADVVTKLKEAVTLAEAVTVDRAAVSASLQAAVELIEAGA